MTFQVKLADQNGERKLLAKKQMDIIDVLGVKLEELDRDTAGKLGIEGGVRVTEMGNGLLKNQTPPVSSASSSMA